MLQAASNLLAAAPSSTINKDISVMPVGGFRIEVPETLSDRDLGAFFRGWTWFDDPQDPVVLDFSRVVFIAPWAITLFAAYALWLREVRGKSVQVWIDETTEAGRFLVRAGLRQLVEDQQQTAVLASTERICPLVRISKSEEIPRYANSVMQLLAIEDEDMAGAIRYALFELLRNVVQHSRSRIGAVALAAFFPNAGIADFVVADIGRGIRASLREGYPELSTDYKAVRFATQPHISSTFARGAYHSMANNAGLGLFFIKEIVSRGGGGFFLGSGSMLADYWGNKDGSPGKSYIESRTGGWRGTFALFQQRRELIADFDVLLQRCREIAAAFRRDPSELRLDFTDTIPEIDGLMIIRVVDFDEDVERAAIVREEQLIPALADGSLVVLDFEGIRAATQSFAHALLYRVFRDVEAAIHGLTIARATKATQQAIRAVSAYAVADS